MTLIALLTFRQEDDSCGQTRLGRHDSYKRRRYDIQIGLIHVSLFMYPRVMASLVSAIYECGIN